MVPVPYPHTSTILLRGQSGWMDCNVPQATAHHTGSIQVASLHASRHGLERRDCASIASRGRDQHIQAGDICQSRGEGNEISSAVQHTHTHVTSARPPPPLHRRREYQPPSSSFRFRRRSRINTNTPPPLEHFCIRLAASGLSRTLSLLLVSSPLQDATTESRHQPPPPAHRSARRPGG